jgi:nucleotide-binding universal stress UspA family protein
VTLQRPPRRVPSYRRLLVPVSGRESEQAVAIACELAAEHGASVVAVHAVEVPADLPLDAHMIEEEAHAKRLLAETQAVGDLYGLTITVRVLRTRAAGPAIVEEAQRLGSEIIVLRAPRKARTGRRAPIFGPTARHVLTHASCRVMVAAAPAEP